jgi:hypothetical protein
MADFPTAEVCRILGLSEDAPPYLNIEGVSPAQLRELIALGVADPAMQQNASPTIGAFLDEFGHYPSVGYIGYVCLPPRTDSRVSLDGVAIAGLTSAEAVAVADRYHTADSYTQGGNAAEGYSFRLWWD